jgi:DNA-binding MarR family transcriptional regulator
MTKQPRWLNERELETWEGFLAAGTILNRRIEQQLKDDAGLSHSQYEVLARLSAAPGNELRMTELAGIARTSKSGLTYQVSQLEKAGLVRRTAAPGDDRGIFATLTAKGRRVIEKVAPAHAALVRELFLDGLTKEQFTGLADAVQALRLRLAAGE